MKGLQAAACMAEVVQDHGHTLAGSSKQAQASQVEGGRNSATIDTKQHDSF